MGRICIIFNEQFCVVKEVTKEDLLKIKEFIEDIRFGSVTVIVQDGRIIQIEKKEKVRLNH